MNSHLPLRLLFVLIVVPCLVVVPETARGRPARPKFPALQTVAQGGDKGSQETVFGRVGFPSSGNQSAKVIITRVDLEAQRAGGISFVVDSKGTRLTSADFAIKYTQALGDLGKSSLALPDLAALDSLLKEETSGKLTADASGRLSTLLRKADLTNAIILEIGGENLPARIQDGNLVLSGRFKTIQYDPARKRQPATRVAQDVRFAVFDTTEVVHELVGLSVGRLLSSKP